MLKLCHDIFPKLNTDNQKHFARLFGEHIVNKHLKGDDDSSSVHIDHCENTAVNNDV